MVTHVDNVVNFTASANVAYGEAIALLQAARKWTQCEDLSYDEIMADDPEFKIAGRRIKGEREAKVVEMERSLLSNLVHLLTGPQAHDGPITVTRDMEASFFWRHEKSGYHGGLIFHKDHSLPADLRVGTWSIHT